MTEPTPEPRSFVAYPPGVYSERQLPPSYRPIEREAMALDLGCLSRAWSYLMGKAARFPRLWRAGR